MNNPDVVEFPKNHQSMMKSHEIIWNHIIPYYYSVICSHQGDQMIQPDLRCYDGNQWELSADEFLPHWYHLIPNHRFVKICQDIPMSLHSEHLHRVFYLKIQYHTVPYSTIEYHRVPPKIPTRKICKSSNDVLRFFPNEHIAISNSATVASRPSRPSRPCLGSRKISWIFGSNLWIVYRNEPQKFHEFQMLLSSEK